MSAITHILRSRIVAIIRGANAAEAIDIAQALHSGGIDLIEVTMNSPNAIATITTLRKRLGETVVIGAGTVLDAATAEQVIEAGAEFVLSPVTDVGVIEATKKKGAVSVPGAFTPSEIVRAFSMGGDIVKVFPARFGPDYIRDILAPLPDLLLMPTGGITIDNISGFQKAGAVSFGVGSSLVNMKDKLNDRWLDSISKHAKQFFDAIQHSGNFPQ